MVAPALRVYQTSIRIFRCGNHNDLMVIFLTMTKMFYCSTIRVSQPLGLKNLLGWGTSNPSKQHVGLLHDTIKADDLTEPVFLIDSGRVGFISNMKKHESCKKF